MPAPQIILDLIERFERNKEAYKSGAYNGNFTLFHSITLCKLFDGLSDISTEKSKFKRKHATGFI